MTVAKACSLAQERLVEWPPLQRSLFSALVHWSMFSLDIHVHETLPSFSRYFVIFSLFFVCAQFIDIQHVYGILPEYVFPRGFL